MQTTVSDGHATRSSTNAIVIFQFHCRESFTVYLFLETTFHISFQSKVHDHAAVF